MFGKKSVRQPPSEAEVNGVDGVAPEDVASGLAPWWSRWLPTGFRGNRRLSKEEFKRSRDQLIEKAPPPTIWLFGKTGSGKSSIVKLLTGMDQVQLGNGFQPATRETFRYDFPDPDMPVMRFLDTRGLDEPGYDAATDIAELHEEAHAMIVTQRVMKFTEEAVIGPLKQIRQSKPSRPVLLALTHLHEAYPQQQHPVYPFTKTLSPRGLPESLSRALAEQCRRFGGLVDGVVPIDLTRPEDGFQPHDYGGAKLKDTLVSLLPSAVRCALRNATELFSQLQDLHEQAAMPYVLGGARMAASAAAAPLPWIGMPFVVAIQTRMVFSIASIYHQEKHVRHLGDLLAAAGVGFLTRLGIRELLKLIPPPYGWTVGGAVSAALTYSYTYALGRVCCWYYGCLREGHEPTKEEIARAFRLNYRDGVQFWRAMTPKGQGSP